MAETGNRDRIAREHDDRVCAGCNGILRWYSDKVGYFHVRLRGQWYITGHKPDPSPTD
jgi:hypothetical protein